MNFARLTLPVAIGFGSLLFLGCGGSSKSSTPTSAAMSVHLVDGPISGYQEINVNIQSVEISGSGGWTTLGTPNKTINLLNLVGGVEETLANGASLPAGHYGQMRLILGSGNTVKLSDGSVHALTVPSGLQTGVKLVVSFDVAAGTTKDVWIDFDAAHSIQLIQAGASNQYLLRPTVWAYDKVVTGSISGKLTDAGSASALAGATVYAETLDASGNARIARSTTTDASGAYTLDLLPVGATYYVVSQPLVGSTTLKAYDAKASDAYALTATSPVFTYSAAFTSDASLGGVSGDLTPVATSSESDQVNLLASLTSPTSGTHTFIVDTTMAIVGTSTETYGFSNLPIGTYSLQAIRTTLNLDGTTSSSASTVQPAAVTAGVTLTVNLGL
ncbi:hypothetical protein GETHLI_34670 [Geothrix limicola]|uniref:DUF4382 domain-containing protein n=1 Tax=Geothrix limicola TaxID=2927978 RepID=A0ABQ5QJB6_9BACT|nr:DUF4382 domain-containing protein [Geothrix limicola]GLH74965.1 hypothetical protein GETHLI_34670 [Geothrix limicola]